jgi:hypothetical protein
MACTDGTGGLSHHVNSVQGCGHAFCHACLLNLFGRAMPGALWYTCPQCKGPILTPPRPDEGLRAAVLWLRLAQGEEVSSVPLAPSDAFNVYFWR